MKHQPKITEKVRLTGAEKGSVMYGEYVPSVKIQLGKHSFEWNVYIAPISDDCLLGLDFLMKHVSCLDFEKQILQIRDQCISATIGMSKRKDRAANVCRVTLPKRVVVPPDSWKMVKGEMDQSNPFDDPEQEVVFNPGKCKGLLVPHTIVKATPKIPIKLVNPMPHWAVLKKHHVVSNLEESGEIVSNEDTDSVSVCKVDVIGEEGSSPDSDFEDLLDDQNESNLEQVKSSIPEHLTDLFN